MPCSFVPPYLLRHLASLTTDDPGAAPTRTLTLDVQLRGLRSSPPAELPTLLPERATATATAVAARRVIHSAGGTEQLPGTPARRDDDPPTGDAAVDEAHSSSAQVWDLFAGQFGRVSVDGAGTTLSVTVHYGRDYDNAFWDGRQLVFGDGDGQVFERFTKPMDVMAHEFTHGVTQFSAGLTYQGQSGALNESVSDVFAAMTKQHLLAQEAAAADWLIGEGLFRPGINAKALRSMLEPGTAYDDPQLGRDPQVGSMADYVETTEDNGGVHLNSGIPNRAFALAAIAVGGASWERTGKVWYDVLTGGQIGADADFVAFAEATAASAARLFADDPTVAEHIRAAWEQVGVLTAEGSAPADPPGDLVAVLPNASAHRVAVSRSGGFTGVVRAGELDLDGDPQGPEVRDLLQRTDFSALSAGTPAVDRFVYTLAVDDWQLTLPEQDLTPELDQVVRIVLGGRRGTELTPGEQDLGTGGAPGLG